MQEVKAGLCIEMVDVHQPDEIGPEGWVPGSSQGSQGHEKTWGWQGPRSWQLSRVVWHVGPQFSASDSKPLSAGRSTKFQQFVARLWLISSAAALTPVCHLFCNDGISRKSCLPRIKGQPRLKPPTTRRGTKCRTHRQHVDTASSRGRCCANQVLCCHNLAERRSIWPASKFAGCGSIQGQRRYRLCPWKLLCRRQWGGYYPGLLSGRWRTWRALL